MLWLIFLILANLVRGQQGTPAGCVLTTDDASFPAGVSFIDVQIYENDEVSQTHTDWTFQWQFNKTLTGVQIYAQINFTDFLKATDLRLEPRQIQCQQQRYFEVSHCMVIYAENLVEVGYIRDYRKQRVDFPNGDFCDMFYRGAFTIRNLPTPYAVWDEYPPLKIVFYEGSGGEEYYEDTLIASTTADVKFSAAPVINFGTVLSKALFSKSLQRVVEPGQQTEILDPVEYTPTNVVDLYFTPSIAIFNQSYIEIQFPRGIQLPMSIKNIDEITESLIKDPWVRIPCEPIQSLDIATVECWLQLNLIYEDDDQADIAIETDTVSEPDPEEEIMTEDQESASDAKTRILTDFGTTNRVRVMGGFEGASLIWKAPEFKPIYIPNKPVVPPWIDPLVDHRKKEFTYIDGEYINLDSFEIVGDKTFEDIDLNEDGNLDYHEILVYFAKVADKKNQEYDFKLNYYIQSRYKNQVHLDVPREMLAQGLPDDPIFYEPAYYSLRFPEIEVYESKKPLTLGEQAYQVQIFDKDGNLQQRSDPLDEQYMLDFDHVHSFLYTEYVGWARCMAEVGCVEQRTSDEELETLMVFYEQFNGDEWRFNDNWMEGDPCLNQWYGVGCNTEGNIVSLHFFENHLKGELQEEITDLVHLKHLSIFNGDASFQNIPNKNANEILKLPSQLAGLTQLEEINCSWVKLAGTIPYDLIDLKKLRFVNFANNDLEGSLPLRGWENLQRLEILELQHNGLSGQIPKSFAFMTELTYVNLSHNNLNGEIPIFTAAQKLQGIELSYNDLKRFPIEYFSEESFQRLDFINVNFNDKQNMAIPEVCRRYIYCYKRVVKVSREGNKFFAVPKETQDLIERSSDDLVY